MVAEKQIDQLCIDTIRTLSMDAVQKAHSGHPGTPMAMAPVIYCLWQRFLRFDPNDPIWPNRDRFVLSIGHASMLLYSMLHLTGVKAVNAKYESLGNLSVTLDDIKKFRQLDSKCPGHPEYRWTSGVETTTGPLGQGVAVSAGMAIACRWMGRYFNRPGFDMIDYNVFALCGDGDMMEGITNDDPGAFERMGLIFWAYMRGLKYLVLNNHLCESLKEYFQNTDLENTERLISTITPQDQEEETNDNVGVVDVETPPEIKFWDLNKLLNNFSPHVKRDLLKKEVTAEAVLSCLFYIASSKGDNLGLGYVVEKLKVRPQEGQGGIYCRIAEDKPEEIVAKLRSYLEYRSFQNRDWRVAMGTPSTEKILELLEHLGLDSSTFGSRWD